MATTDAATLAEKVPADAIVYLGWQGAKAIEPAYQQSRMKQVVAAGDGAMTRGYLLRLAKKIGSSKESWAPAFRAMIPAIELAWDSPTAFYIAPGEEPRVILLMDAGAAAPTVVSKLEPVLANLSPDETVTVRAVGQYVIAGSGIDDATANLLAGAGQGQATLATQPEFVGMLKQVDPSAALTCYLNVDALSHELARQQPAKWPAVRDGVSLQGLHGMISTAGFDGKSWLTRTFAAAPAPRSGISAMFESKPLSPELLQAIPKDATLALVGQFDLQNALSLAKTLAATDAHDAASFQQAMLGIKTATGVDVETELATSLGNEWALYSSPQIGGSRINAWVAANRLKNPGLAEQSLQRIQGALCMIASQGMAQSGMQLPGYTIQQGDLTIHYLGLMAISPAWTIQDGILYMGAYPQVVASAAAAAKSGGESILQNSTVKAAKDHLGRVPGGFGYVNLPVTCQEGYGTALLISRYALGLSDMFGVQSPPMFVPPLEKLQTAVEPSMSVSWSDDAGWHKQSAEPFPLSDLLSGDLSATAAIQPGVLAAIIIPQFTNASNDARQSSLLSMVQSLRSQCELYNLQHNAYPDFVKYPNWEQLLQKTSEDGVPAATGRFGPYVGTPPMNPWNGQVGIEVSQTAVRPGYRPKNPKAGWVVDGTTHRFYGVGKSGSVEHDQ